MIHDQGRVPGPQPKPFQKTTSDEQEQGRVAAPKQRKEYQKKHPQSKFVEGPTDKLKIDAPDGLMQGHFWVTLLLIKQVDGRMILQILLEGRVE